MTLSLINHRSLPMGRGQFHLAWEFKLLLITLPVTNSLFSKISKSHVWVSIKPTARVLLIDLLVLLSQLVTGGWKWPLHYFSPWCNGYHCRKRTWRHVFKSWTRLIAFNIALIPLGKVWILLFTLQLWINSKADWVLQPCLGSQSRKKKTVNSNLLNSA